MPHLNFSVVLNAAGGPLGLIRASGADAGSFLQGQLTQDVVLLAPSQARLAAWCSAKGRMLASFWVIKLSNEDFLLILSRDLLDATLKRLKMFVLRAKCELRDVTTQYSVMGLAGTAWTDLLGAPQSIATTRDFIRAEGQIDQEIRLFLPPAALSGPTAARGLRILPQTPALEGDANLLEAWAALEVASGIARVSAAVSEAFVPQMLNYESVGGVNFKKGCYPGQEVVARSQFRGTLKRRGYILSGGAAMAAGQEVFDANDPDQACGTIAQAARWDDQTHIALASLQISAAEANALHLGSAQGPSLTLLSLPYTLLADV
jgi:tRNA-modifying protein YgfZ